MQQSSRRSARPRLAALAEMIPEGSRVLDIGTDRALLPRYLLATGRAAFCIASERDRVRLARVPASARTWGERLELRHGDGVTVLEEADAVDVVVIAGLGAHSICRILGRRELAQLGVRRLVLQPQTAPALLRRRLEAYGFGILDERLVEESGRFFTIIAAEPDLPPVVATEGLSRNEVLEVGPCLLRSGDPNLPRYWRQELDRNQAILNIGPTGPGRAEASRRQELAARLLGFLNRRTCTRGRGV